MGEFWVVLPLGVAIGLVMGTLGGGGSILTVPALVYLLGEDPATATTASLAIVGTTSAIGTLAHGRARRVRWGAGVTVGVLGVGGAWVGSRLATGVDPQVLLLGFAVLMLVAAQGMLRRTYGGRAPSSASASASAGSVPFPPADGPLLPTPDDGTTPDGATHTPDGATHTPAEPTPAEPTPAEPTPAEPTHRRPRPRGSLRGLSPGGWARLLLAATGVGLITGFFGVGGGFVVVPALVLVLGFAMPVAIGTSLLVITINSVTALASRALVAPPDLDWALVAPFAAAAVVGVLAGSRLSGRLPERTLSRAFAILLILLALGIGTSAVLALTGVS